MTYTAPSDAVAALTKEWLATTTLSDPVIGWPIGDYIRVAFQGRIPVYAYEMIEWAIRWNFDDKDKTCLFPIAKIQITVEKNDETGRDRDESNMVTVITITGDRDRAHEMVHPLVPQAGAQQL